ncbi:hypothetical protein EOI86_15375 [Hwanghaeella grinnelliae]|uniref:Uncharacterized protein n=1 Tax=Hwanghaeella grinnelliae TaxID=2500179 RepID=A0A3S2VMQ5_9PROT|nr:hypothetical protein [Hwanghaeella grinnelliae]RVU36567.1 hypothetical protein EOI86_15375 [Hwanghaeella grinnelliae]
MTEHADPTQGDRMQDEPAQESDVVRTVQQTLTEAADAILDAVKSYALPHFARLERHILYRAAGFSLAVLAAVWGAIALTLAAAQILPLWASYLCVSAFLAVGAASAFIIPSLGNGKRISGRTTHLEGGK